MSRTYRILIVAVVAFAAGAGYWKFALAPKRAEAAEVQKRVAFQTAQLAQTQNLIATYQGAKEAYRANYATVLRLGKAVPKDDDTRSLIVQLDSAAKRSGIDFDSMNINGGGSAASGTGTTTTAPGAINVGAFAAMPFAFSFSGSFNTLGNFFTRLESFVALKNDKIAVNGRLLRVESISLVPGEGGWPALNATVGASSYIVPEGQAAAAATPATGVAGAPPATGSTGTTTTANTAGTTPTENR